MPIVVEDVLEVALLVEREPRSVWVFAPEREVAELVDGVRLHAVAVLTEVGELNDSTVDSFAAISSETALLADSHEQTIVFTRTATETVEVDDTATAGIRIQHDEREVGELNDSSDGTALVVLSESALLLDSTTISQTHSLSLRDTGELESQLYWPLSVNVNEVAEANDNVSFFTTASVSLRETALLSDSIQEDTNTSVVLREIGKLADSVANVLTTNGDLRDKFYSADNPVPPSYGRAYTCSIANWAMSLYSNYPFLTMAGNLAAGDNLWQLDADTDYGDPITSRSTTIVYDMGDSHVKRLSALYVAGESSGPMDISVTADVNGVRETYEYSLELRDQEDYRNNRALVGKGFRGRFVQFSLGATGVDYKLLAAEADVAVTNRRF